MTRTRRKWIGLGAGAAVLVLAIGCLTYAAAHLSSDNDEIPTTRVQRGTVEMDVYSQGELRTSQSSMVVAPPVRGTLQIVKMAPTGTLVKAGDVILEFDPSEQEYNLEQSQSRLQEAEQQITKSKADAAVQAAQDKVALLSGRFDVRRAELEVQRNELLGDIDAKKNVLALEEAKRRLAQLEKDVKSREASNRAALAVLQEQRNQSMLGMEQAKRSIQNMTIKAPISGLVSVKENWDAMGGVRFSGMELPSYREGDMVQPGRFVLEVLDVEHMLVSAAINEIDRTNVNPGQNANITVHASPGTTYHGKLKSIAGMVSRNSMFDSEGTKRFDASFEFDNRDAILRPGLTADVVVRGSSLADKLFLPRQCVFDKEGKLLVYVRKGSGFEAREIKVISRTESRAVIEGLNEGTEVALLDPTARSTTAKRGGAAPGGTAGGAQ